MHRIVIIADDLTGAADCSVACVKAGVTAIVSLSELHPDIDTDVLAFDADTRAMTSMAAAQRMYDLTRQHASEPSVILFKKIDSTLRGHLVPELSAMLRARRETVSDAIAIMAPAFPAAGRVTRAAVQYLHGAPLHDSEMWRREAIVGEAHIPGMLASSGLRCIHIDLLTLRGDRSALLQFVRSSADGCDVILLDADTDEDLVNIAAVAASLGERALWVGSAGLAEHLVQACNVRPEREHTCPEPPSTKGPSLFVLGSASQTVRQQAAALLAAPGIYGIVVPPDTLLAGPGQPGWSVFTAKLEDAIARGLDVVLQCGPEPEIAPELRATLSHALGEMTANLHDRLGAVVASGGETARKVLDRWRIRSLRLLGELEKGVPFSTAVAGTSRPLTVITKAGDFGQSHTLLHCLEWLTQARTNSMKRPIIAITMGDAAGVGPEIIMKSFSHTELYTMCRPLVVGDAERLRAAGKIVRSNAVVQALNPDEIDNAQFHPGTIDCIDLGLIPADLPWGKLSPTAGDAAYQYIAIAANLALTGKIGAICTAPLNKEALHAGGHKYPGHTEMLAALIGVDEVSMMLSTPRLKVTHVTTHMGLIDAIARIEPGLVERTIDRARSVLVKAGVPEPRIGVCGINPHAGENGLFGNGEEESKIVPAVEACRAKGWNVTGPMPADTLFYLAQRGDFDMVIAMYHDQGHGPVKVLGLESGVNITVGLPVVRTSVDHGTAFDIAGKGIADERSMMEAMRQAAELAP